jgi:hypothetical protein
MKTEYLAIAVSSSVQSEHAAKIVIFIFAVGKTRRLKVEDIENEFLKKDWLPDTVEHGTVHAYVISDTAKSGRTWTAEQVRALPHLRLRRLFSGKIWGFETINKERRYTRHVNFTGPQQENIQAKLVYDYGWFFQHPSARRLSV